MPVKANRLTATCDIARIVQGEAMTLVVEVFDEVSGEAFNLAEMTAATATFLGSVDSEGVTVPVEVTATANGDPGRLNIELATDDTLAMRIGDGQSWQIDIELDSGTTVRRVQLVEQLDVVASLF